MTDVATYQGSSPETPIATYRAALKRTDPSRLLVIAKTLGIDDARRASKIPDRIAEFWSECRGIEARLAPMPNDSRIALSLFSLADMPVWRGTDLKKSFGLLGISGEEAITPLLDLGLLAARPTAVAGHFPPPPEKSLGPESDGETYDFVIHPSIPGAVRTVLPVGELITTDASVVTVRQTDGLEAVLRVAAVWQRLGEAPLRRTQNGSYFKRDRERIEDDPSLVGPITDALEPLPDMAMLWVGLAEAVGLVFDETGSDRIIAASPEFWSENSFHIPQMVATRWLSIENWHELGGSRNETSPTNLTTVALRVPALLHLAKAPAESWVALDDLTAFLESIRPNWGTEFWPIAAKKDQPSVERMLIEAVLLGPAYQLGLIRAAEERPSGRRVVQLSPLGRYALGLGHPPTPPPDYEHFLFVQPNFEIIAYRQGLTPSLIGKFSRFATWSKLGAAIELKLTADGVYRGLEGGFSTDSMLALLTKHSSRPLPPGISEALRTWSHRRERLTYYASATLVEFASPEELETALIDWPGESGKAPIRVAPRLILVDDVATIPFQKFRQTGARDYRRTPEPCVEIGADGVSLWIDLGRSDLLVDAEIVRFADEQPAMRDSGVARRKFSVTRETLARGIDAGLSSSNLARWFLERAGVAMPPAIRLLLHAATPGGPPLGASRRLVVSTPTADLLDGLLQHPSTCDAFSERLGPTHAVVTERLWPTLKRTLDHLGLAILDSPETPADRYVEDREPEANDSPGPQSFPSRS